MISADDAITDLNDCGCCEGISAETPLSVFNRPGLSAILYRTGTHAQFKDTLIARLSGLNEPALRKLTTRDDDDFSIALLDAWATVADVLTFYEERIANEAYLRTATERLSVLELARLINYQLRPGVAASAYLAFTLEDAPGPLGQAQAVGTTAQISPEQLPPIVIASGTNLKLGDRLLLIDGANNTAVKTILKITEDDDTKTTRVDFATAPPPLPAYTRPINLQVGIIGNFENRMVLSNNNSVQIISQSWRSQDLFALTRIQGWSLTALEGNLVQPT